MIHRVENRQRMHALQVNEVFVPGGGGYWGFQVTGMIEGFFWV